MSNGRLSFSFTILLLGIAFLYIPMFVLIGYSFNSSSLVSVWGGFSFHWYGSLLHNRQVLDAAALSLEIALVASSGAVILGLMAAIALVRFRVFPGRLLLTGMVNAPLVMPEIITGTSMPRSSVISAIAYSAALALSVSKMVSTSSRSAPPSSSPLICSP